MFFVRHRYRPPPTVLHLSKNIFWGFPYQISNWLCFSFDFDFLSGINRSSRVSLASVFPANYVVQAFDFLKHFVYNYISLFKIIFYLVFISVPVFFIFVDWCWFYFFEIINIISILLPFCPVLIYFWLCSILRNFPSSAQLWFLQFSCWFDAFN